MNYFYILIEADGWLESSLGSAGKGFLQIFPRCCFVGVDKIEFRLLFFFLMDWGRNPLSFYDFFVIKIVFVGLPIFFLQFQFFFEEKHALESIGKLVWRGILSLGLAILSGFMNFLFLKKLLKLPQGFDFLHLIIVLFIDIVPFVDWLVFSRQYYRIHVVVVHVHRLPCFYCIHSININLFHNIISHFNIHHSSLLFGDNIIHYQEFEFMLDIMLLWDSGRKFL